MASQKKRKLSRKEIELEDKDRAELEKKKAARKKAINSALSRY